jgi:uncharacterized protein (DUF362 family)
MAHSQVAVLKTVDYLEGTTKLFSLLDVEGRLRSAKRVLIKINLVRMPPQIKLPLTNRSPRKPAPYRYHGNRGIAYTPAIAVDGDITRIKHIKALVHALHSLGVEQIAICEGACGWDTTLAYKVLGYEELSQKYGVRLVDTNWSEPTTIPVPNGKRLKDFWLAKEYLESDFRINVTTLKVHGATCVSLCLKNWAIGLPSAIRYGVNRTANRIRGQGDSFPIHQHYDREEIYGQGVGIAETIADVNSAIPYELGIIDGLTTIHYGKLMNLAERRDAQGKLPVYQTKLLFASFDRVAVDAVASRVMKLNPYKIYHQYLSAERGCGTIDLEKIDVLGERIDDIEMTCFPMLKQRATML